MQFQELEQLGFSGFAVAFYEDKMELVSTCAMTESFTPQMIEYLHALTITGKILMQCSMCFLHINFIILL